MKTTYSQYDEIANDYDSLFLDKESLAENEEVRAMLSPLRGSVYEIGCGTGLLVDLFPDIEPSSYCGIDPSNMMVRNFVTKHPCFERSIHVEPYNGTDEDIRDYDNVVSLFGSISYVSGYGLSVIASLKCKKFLMFYKPEYTPVTYLKTHVSFKHNIYQKDKLEYLFKDCEVIEYHNYIIVKSR